ncbi:MAG: winged helix-turn-helix domain-containing protein, partial [Gammaproteobacteria bacterium]
MTELSTDLRIGAYRVLPREGRIEGPDGEAHVQPKIIDVLICLAGKAGEVVSREDLHSQVWGNVIVTDDALNRCISELRRVFGDKRGNANHIETVPKRGYRLIAEVTFSDADEHQESDSTRKAPPGLDNSISTIAVIPFENQTPDSPHSFLAEAIPSSLHSSLARLNRIRVSSRRTSFALAGADMPADELGSKLGAQYIVSGSIAGAGDNVRVIAEVDDANAGILLWSERFEVNGTNLLSFEQELTEAIIGAFGGQRLKSEISRAQEAPPSQLDSWGLVQKARAYLVEYNPENLRAARELLREAADKDPNYASA